MADVQFLSTPAGAALRIEEPQGPLIVIEQDGTVTVSRGPHDEAGRLFWDAVKVHGATYREKIAMLMNENQHLAQMIATLQKDVWRDALSHGEPIWEELPKHIKKHVTKADVHAVLEAVTNIAMRKMQ